jgi:spore maturation protein CgeB
MKILFIASLHHPEETGVSRTHAPPFFPISQAHSFWVKALERMGHTCQVFWRSAPAQRLYVTHRPSRRRLVAGLAARFPELNPAARLRNRQLLSVAIQFQADILVLVGGNQLILPQTLRQLKQLDPRPTLIYTCGTPPETFAHRIERAAAGLYDLVVANDQGHADQWRRLGAPHSVVLPMSAVDPAFHRPAASPPAGPARAEGQIGFVGTLVPSNLYSQRIAALERLRGFDLAIWSVHEVPASLRAHNRGPALGHEMLRALQTSAIVVNPHGDFMPWGGNMRLFEACGAGCLQIVNDCPAVHQWFEPDRHLLTYRSIDELPGIVKSMLAQPAERGRIARAGQDHVHQHHTYQQRMIRFLGLVDELRSS